MLINIVIVSQAFAPLIGGVEAVGETLATGLANRGHRVTVVTRTTKDDAAARPFRISRDPGPLQLLKLISSADVVLHNNLVARLLWASVLSRTPTVVAHHTWLPKAAGPKDLAAMLKRWTAGRFTTATVSALLATDRPGPVTVIPNGCDLSVFRPSLTPPRSGVAFVGRLVSDKGCELLIDAFAEARQTGVISLDEKLTIVGDGPQLPSIKARIAAHDLAAHVTLTGSLTKTATAQVMGENRVVAVPSLWREPFGLVGLEAAACGCSVVVPRDTGLAEAAGPSAVPFERGDVTDLCRALGVALSRPPDARAAEEHRRRMSHDGQIDAYEALLVDTARGRPARRPSRPPRTSDLRSHTMLQRIRTFYSRPDIRESPLLLTFRRLNLELLRKLPGRAALSRIRTFKLTDGLLVSTPLNDVVGYNLYTHGGFEWSVRQQLLAAITPGSVVLDVGAHLGSFTLPAAQAAGHRGRVIALEPQPVTRSLLRMNVHQNDLSDRVQILPFAALDHADQLALGSTDAGNSGMAKIGVGDQLVECRRIDDIDTVVNLDRLDVVKIDVEGLEVEVLRGMGTLIDDHRPVVIFEVNDERALQFFDDHPAYEVDLIATDGHRSRWQPGTQLPQHAGDTLNAIAQPIPALVS